MNTNMEWGELKDVPCFFPNLPDDLPLPAGCPSIKAPLRQEEKL